MTWSHSGKGLTITLEEAALQEWQETGKIYHGYMRNATAMTLLYAALESRGISKTNIIKGYSLDKINYLYERKKMDGHAIFKAIQAATQQSLDDVKAAKPILKLETFLPQGQVGSKAATDDPGGIDFTNNAYELRSNGKTVNPFLVNGPYNSYFELHPPEGFSPIIIKVFSVTSLASIIES